MPEHDIVSAELLEKSLCQEALWKRTDAHECVSPLVFMKRPGSDDFTVGVLRYENVESFLEAMKGETEAYTAQDFREITGLQDGFAKLFPRNKRYGGEFGHGKGPKFNQLYGDGSYAYLLANYGEPSRATDATEASFAATFTVLNELHGVRYSPSVVSINTVGEHNSGGRIINTDARKGDDGIFWVPNELETAWTDYRMRIPQLSGIIAKTKKHTFPSGKLYLPDLRPFAGQAEIMK